MKIRCMISLQKRKPERFPKLEEELSIQFSNKVDCLFRNLFLSHKRLILGILNDALEQAVDFIAELSVMNP